MDNLEQILERRAWLTPLILAALCILVYGSRLSMIEGNHLSAGHDMAAWFYPQLTFITETTLDSEFPLWNPYIFAGHPTVANPQFGLFYPATWLMLLFPVNVVFAVSAIFHLWLGGVGMASLARTFEATRLGALLAGITFMFGEYMAARIHYGHYTLLLVSCWLPWVLLAARWTVQQKTTRSAILAGAVLGMAALAGHTTTLLFVLLGLACIWIYEMVTRRAWAAPTRQIVIMGVFAVALSAIILVPLAEFAQVSSRQSSMFDAGDAGDFAMPAVQLITAVIPDFFGGPHLESYWGAKNFQELTFYTGVFALAGAAFALYRRSAATYFFLGMGVLGALFSLGHAGGLFTLFYRWAPVFQLARAPGRAMLLVVVALAALSGLLLSWLQRAAPDERRQALRGWVRVSAAVAAALVSAALLLFALGVQQTAAESDPKLPWPTASALGEAALVMAGLSVVLWLWQAEVDQARLAWVAALTLGLVCVDLARFHLLLTPLTPIAPSPMWQAVKDVAGVEGDPAFRALYWGDDFKHQNRAMQFGIYTPQGYDPLVVEDYIQFLNALEDPRAVPYTLVNVRYIVTQYRPLELPYSDTPLELTLLGQQGDYYVYDRPAAQPRAFVARVYDVIPDRAAALARINGPGFDSAARVILDREPPCDIGGGAGTAEITHYSPNTVTLSVALSTDALVVLSDVFYPGWTADVDGAPAEILRADVALRGVCVPAGAHTVTMRYRPISFILGAGITLGALGILVMAGVQQRRCIQRKQGGDGS
ncbi:MAG: YfhO family protein [Anaerolineae bacterium]|nr:YfhO family protein [Anaerolineae bacterium]